MVRLFWDECFQMKVVDDLELSSSHLFAQEFPSHFLPWEVPCITHIQYPSGAKNTDGKIVAQRRTQQDMS